jgi:Family of unknown function (DUF6174)
MLFLLALLLPVAGCGDPVGSRAEGGRQGFAGNPTQSHYGEWDAPPNYSFDLRSRCGEQTLIGTFRVAVLDGDVVDVKGLDESGAAAVAALRDDFPSLTDLMAFAEEAQASDADIVRIEMDPEEGFPKRIQIDYNLDAIDDESCFAITNYSSNP